MYRQHSVFNNQETFALQHIRNIKPKSVELIKYCMLFSIILSWLEQQSCIFDFRTLRLSNFSFCKLYTNRVVPVNVLECAGDEFYFTCYLIVVVREALKLLGYFERTEANWRRN